MQFKKFGDRVQLRFESGEHLAATLIDWLTAQDIGYASMTGLGAVSGATISYWNADAQKYESHELTEQMEVVSLIGNVTIKDGKPFPHLHLTLGKRDLSVVGGHFNDAVVNPLLEVWLKTESEPVHRTLDETCGLYVMQLPERA